MITLVCMTICIILLLIILLSRFDQKRPVQKLKKNTHFLSTDEKKVIGPSRVVLHFQSQPVQTSASTSQAELSEQKTPTFAEENELLGIHIPLEFGGVGEEDDTFEEDEWFQIWDGDEVAERASGISFEDMNLLVNEVINSTDQNETKTAELLYWQQNTDYVMQLTRLSPEKAERINYLLNLHTLTVETISDKEEDRMLKDITRFID